MSVNYSLDGDEVKATITIPESQEVKALGEKSKVVTELEAEIAKAQETIDSYTAIKAEVQAKLDAINAL